MTPADVLCTAHPDLDWHSDDPAEQEACKAICRGCPLAVSCLADARARGEQWGVWGAVSFNLADETADDWAELPATVRVSVYAPAHGENRFYDRCKAGEDGRACDACRASHALHVSRWRSTHSPAPVRPVVDLPQLSLFGEIAAVTTSAKVMA